MDRAAADPDSLAGDEAAGVAREIEDGADQIFRVEVASQGLAGGDDFDYVTIL